MVKIDAPSSLGTVVSTKIRKPSEKKKSGFSSALKASSKKETTGTQDTNEIQGIESLVQLQEISEDALSQKKLHKHGDQLLMGLENLRLSILEGSLSQSSLQNLSTLLKNRPDLKEDSPLSSIVQEIEQRVHIELAKIEMSQSRR